MPIFLNGGGGVIDWGLIVRLLPLLPRLLWPKHWSMDLVLLPRQKIRPLATNSILLVCWPKESLLSASGHVNPIHRRYILGGKKDPCKDPCRYLFAGSLRVAVFKLKNIKTFLNKSPIIYDTRRSLFCLSFPSIDRATAPGQYEQSYLNVKTLTKHVPYPQKLISRTQSDQTRSGNTIL